MTFTRITSFDRKHGYVDGDSLPSEVFAMGETRYLLQQSPMGQRQVYRIIREYKDDDLGSCAQAVEIRNKTRLGELISFYDQTILEEGLRAFEASEAGSFDGDEEVR